MAWVESKQRFRPGAPAGWAAARLELEHQAEHWDTPDHGETGHLIAQALRSAIDIAQSGGLRCEHRVDDAEDEPTGAQSAATHLHRDAA
jgi:hypothetical protein